jgi:hypothetical protein
MCETKSRETFMHTVRRRLRATRPTSRMLAAVVALGVAWVAASAATFPESSQAPASSQDKDKNSGRPRFVLRAQPSIGISPARVVFTAELLGGANDSQEFYCATVEWEWGDDTTSESNVDCEPYEAGKSEIKRRFTTPHIFRRAGEYKVSIRLKQKDKQVAMASTNVQVRPGAREF